MVKTSLKKFSIICEDIFEEVFNDSEAIFEKVFDDGEDNFEEVFGNGVDNFENKIFDLKHFVDIEERSYLAIKAKKNRMVKEVLRSDGL